MLTQEQIESLFNEARPSVLEGLKREMSVQISHEARSEAAKVVRTHVEAWVKANVIPELTLQLIEGKDGLVKAGKLLADAVCDELVKSCVKDLAKKLEQSWERKNIMEAMFA